MTSTQKVLGKCGNGDDDGEDDEDEGVIDDTGNQEPLQWSTCGFASGIYAFGSQDVQKEWKQQEFNREC